MVQGVFLNAWRKPTAYQVYLDNPQESNGMYGKVKTVPADNMLHLAFRKRLHQIRGVSMLHGVIVRLADLKEYEESERVAARIAAAMTMYIKKAMRHCMMTTVTAMANACLILPRCGD